MKIPRPITSLIEYFERLPGVGPKTAQRLTFYLLHFPQDELEKFAQALISLKQETYLCKICKNVSEDEVCKVCSSFDRDQNLIAVVTTPLDAFAIEKTGFKGVYHVLHGVIDPLNNIGPDDIFLKELIHRLRDKNSDITLSDVEIVLATNSSMEGESTAMYIHKLINDEQFNNINIKLSRIARGLPVGGDIEYADDNTLSRALEGRVNMIKYD